MPGYLGLRPLYFMNVCPLCSSRTGAPESDHETREGLSLVIFQIYIPVIVSVLLIVHAAHTLLGETTAEAEFQVEEGLPNPFQCTSIQLLIMKLHKS